MEQDRHAGNEGDNPKPSCAPPGTHHHATTKASPALTKRRWSATPLSSPTSRSRYSKEDFLLKRISLKLSPHQIGVQEMLLVNSLRGRCPEEVFLLGVIPCSTEPGTELTPLLHRRLPELARQLVAELGVDPVQADK